MVTLWHHHCCDRKLIHHVVLDFAFLLVPLVQFVEEDCGFHVALRDLGGVGRFEWSLAGTFRAKKWRRTAKNEKTGSNPSIWALCDATPATFGICGSRGKLFFCQQQIRCLSALQTASPYETRNHHHNYSKQGRRSRRDCLGAAQQRGCWKVM